jgi:predicted O-methyltransferase YrrM
MNCKDFFDHYPQLQNLRALVPDELIQKEIGSRVPEFESWLASARLLIPTGNLNMVFPAELERGSIRLENFLGHWGNVSVEELCKICLIVRWLQPSAILEIGTYNGLTTLQMALNAPAGSVTYTLDLPPQQAASLKLGKIDELVSKHFKQKFNTRTGSYFEGRNDVTIRQLLGDSATFDFAALEMKFDLIFIDAAHDYLNKKADTDNAMRLLTPKGVILWHNYADVSCPEVTRYLNDFAKEHKVCHLRNTSLAVYRGGV